MKLITKIWLLAMCLVLSIGLIDMALAEQPQYTEFSLPIDYKASLAKDEQVFQDVQINLPNGLSDLVSFNIFLKGDFAGAVVRGIVNTSDGIKYCEPNGWTTPNSEGYEMRFDCTTLVDQVIKEKKKSPENLGQVFDSLEITGVGYEVSKSSANVYGDITINYIDDPQGNMDVFGTEYRAQEAATVFLQLRDNQNIPENDGSCYLTLYYPFTFNSTPVAWFTDSPMIHLEGSDGLYYYPIAQLPPTQGIYMMTASCRYSESGFFVYEPVNTETEYPNRTVNLGTYLSDSLVLNMQDDYLYEACASSGGNPKTCQADYDFNLSVNGNAPFTNVTDISLHYMGETDTAGVNLTFYVWNWTSSSWLRLQNDLIFKGGATGPTGLNDHRGNAVPTDGTINPTTNIVRIRLDAQSGTNFNMFNNWLSMEILEANGTVTDLKGSGEIHVNDWFNNYTGLISDAVWNWQERTLTDFDFNVTIDNITSQQIADDTTEAVWNYSGTVNTNVLSQFVNAIWSHLGSIHINILESFSNHSWYNTTGRYTHGEIVP